MIPHPQTMQAVTDQRWHELLVRVDRDRLATTTRPPRTTYRATLHLRLVKAALLLQPILGWRPKIGRSPDAECGAVP